jgi:hypothetical protein
MGQATLAQDRRVSGLARADGRQAEDQRRSDGLLLMPCPAWGIAWASLSSMAAHGGRSTATYLCPRCGHLEPVVTVA